MKRASLTAYPTPPPTDPADLTDRLLEHESDSSARAKPAARSGVKPSRARRSRPHSQHSEPGLDNLGAAPPNAQPASSLQGALSAVEVATEALRQAGQDAPARFDVALRFRLDALAHHLQQVKEFVASLAAH